MSCEKCLPGAAEAKEFCSCTAHDCPNHPLNHENGCTPCIVKNLTRGEIPGCFFNAVNGTQGLHSFYFEDFAREVKKKLEAEGKSL